MAKFEQSMKKFNKLFNTNGELFRVNSPIKLLSSSKKSKRRSKAIEVSKLTADETASSIATDMSHECIQSMKPLPNMEECSETGSDTVSVSSSSSDFVYQKSLIGLGQIPNQVRRKLCSKGFEFTLMVVGGQDLGKSTMVNSLFLTDIYSKTFPGPSERTKETVEVTSTKVLLREGSVNLNLTVVDTPGFGYALDQRDCWKPIVNYIEEQFQEYLTAEKAVHRSAIDDKRVHCCIYFLSPSVRPLKPLDIECLLHLHNKVNIIPIIAKADSLTKEELQLAKEMVMSDIKKHGIKIYDFPDGDVEDDDQLKLNAMKSRVPFGLVGSNYVLEVNGQRKRARQYDWGIVEIDNLNHCDFKPFREMLIKHHLYNLVDSTHYDLYEKYREKHLSTLSKEPGFKGQ